MKTKGQYEKALYDSGFSTKLEYIDHNDSGKNKDQRQKKETSSGSTPLTRKM